VQELKPKWRNGVGMALILLVIAVWSLAVVALSPWVSQLRADHPGEALPFALEALFYVVAGIGWVFPVRPLLAWMAK
jgi:hypothetical protein